MLINENVRKIDIDDWLHRENQPTDPKDKKNLR